ncbi:MAG: hypothetical protein ACYCR4_11145 [Acidimicrobiales bacterium]
MARRMEVELTSSRDDGTWTWRALGAREPRGVVEEKVLPAGAHVGDVLRVEAEFELDGITITTVLPAKGKADPAGLIEIAHRPVAGTVTTTLVGRGGRPGSDRRRGDGLAWAGGPREGAGRDGARSPGRGAPRRDGARPEGSARPTAPSDGPRRDGPDGTDSPPGSAPARRSFPHGGPHPERTGATGRGPGGERPAGGGAGSRPRPEGASGRESASHARPAGRAARPRPPRFVPATAHRDELLATLPEAQRPVALQLAAGGMPAVRRALEEARVTARAEGRSSEPDNAIVALAEKLASSVREAVWLDRAESAVAQLETLSLRDLRATVLGAAPRDDHGRSLLQQLREALDGRVTKLRTAWEADITHALDEGRVLQALRISARTPEPTARFPAALVTRLAEVSGTAMTAETPAERWLALLESVAASPIRRSVKPLGLPEDPSGAVRQAAQAAAGRVPALAPLLGLTMPPPPRPLPPPPPRATAPRPPVERPVVVPEHAAAEIAGSRASGPGPSDEADVPGAEADARDS